MPLEPARLLARDVLRVGSIGLRTRRLRAALSALGISIGIASMIAVLAISESSKADLIARLDRLGTNLLKVAPGQTLIGGGDAKLPATAGRMIGRIPPVDRVSSVETLEQVHVRRTDLIPSVETGGIAVHAADPRLLRTLNGSVRDGAFLNAVTSRYPTVVLGSVAAERLGIQGLRSGLQVYLGEHWFTVVGVLDPVPLAPDLDRSVFIGLPIAKKLFGATGSASMIYVRAHPDTIDDVRSVLASTANPAHPEEVQTSRPSDALAARAATKATFTSLFLGLGAVALLVGGIGIANVMVISVLERRSEIGLRRALGATRMHISEQFLTESLLLAGLGGAAGALIGALISAGYAASRGWTVVLPPTVIAGGVAAALAIGAVAGLYPAIRAARLSPTDALRSA